MKKYAPLTVLFVLLMASTLLAAITVADRTGDVKITFPNGKSVIVTADKPLPKIPDNSVITVLTGSAQIKVTDKSTVKVLVGGNQVTLRGGDAIRVTMATTASGKGGLVVNYQSGNIVVESGSPVIQLLTGSSATLNNLKAEPYHPRTPQRLPNTEVQKEEGSRDISPSQP